MINSRSATATSVLVVMWFVSYPAVVAPLTNRVGTSSAVTRILSTGVCGFDHGGRTCFAASLTDQGNLGAGH